MFNINFYILLSLLLCANQTFCKTTPFQKHETFQVFDANKFPVIFYIRTPQGANKFSITLVLQGSQCESAWNHTVADFEIEAKYNSALLMVEKSGLTNKTSSCPENYLKRNSFDQRIEDVLLVISHLQKNISRWNGEIFLVGGSEGGLLASALSTKVDAKKVVLLVTGGGMTMAEALLHVQEEEMRKQGIPNDQIEVFLDKVKETFKTIRIKPSKTLNWGGEFNTYFYWNSILDKRSLDYILKPKSEYLLVHGTADSSHPVKSARMVAKVFTDLHKTNLKYIEFEGYDHSFTDKKGANHLREVLETSFSWLYK